MKYFIKMLETIDNKQTYLKSESTSVIRYGFPALSSEFTNS